MLSKHSTIEPWLSICYFKTRSDKVAQANLEHSILLPQTPEYQGLQVYATMPGLASSTMKCFPHLGFNFVHGVRLEASKCHLYMTSSPL